MMYVIAYMVIRPCLILVSHRHLKTVKTIIAEISDGIPRSRQNSMIHKYLNDEASKNVSYDIRQQQV